MQTRQDFQSTALREMLAGAKAVEAKAGKPPEVLFVKKANEWTEAIELGGMLAFCLTRVTPEEVASWPSNQVGRLGEIRIILTPERPA